jgi:hypothetical protein
MKRIILTTLFGALLVMVICSTASPPTKAIATTTAFLVEKNSTCTCNATCHTLPPLIGAKVTAANNFGGGITTSPSLYKDDGNSLANSVRKVDKKTEWEKRIVATNTNFTGAKNTETAIPPDNPNPSMCVNTIERGQGITDMTAAGTATTSTGWDVAGFCPS